MKKKFYLGITGLLMVFALACGSDDNGITVTDDGAIGETDDEPAGGEHNPVAEEAYAFPGAEGFGNRASGGRGGQVIKVTNLNDSGTGSLRHAVMASGPRIIVFEVSGTIELSSPLRINNDNVTIAGQTAPGDGVTLKRYPLFVGADNVIIRFMRFRLGDESQEEHDAAWGRYQRNIILDHCSLSWSTDETASFYANQDFTMQWCIISESLNESVHGGGSHGFGGIWGGDRASFHHNLFAHHRSRVPRFNGFRPGTYNAGNPYPNEHVDFRNNVVYNWNGEGSYGGENGKYNMVNNYYKPGPATSSGQRRFLVAYRVAEENWQGLPGYGQFYLEGNHMDGHPDLTDNNWNAVTYKNNLASEEEVRMNSPIDYEINTVHTAGQAYQSVLAHAGASLVRDAVDLRVVNEVQNGTASVGNGIIDSQGDVGGWPQLVQGEVPVDTDGDGMPDEWEIARGLDPHVNDANENHLSTAYDNIEVYINSLVEGIME